MKLLISNPTMLSLFAFLFFAACQSQQETDQETNSTATFTEQDGYYQTISGSFEASGVYPHLTTYTHSRTDQKQSYVPHHSKDRLSEQWECGIGALAEWQGKLYMINYAAHQPKGSEHSLYIVDEDLNMEIFPNSVGGTPAARMIHQESNQLFIGHYAIDAAGKVRVIDIEKMPGRMTAIARHLSDPENMIYYYDMEGMLYEVNVHTLAPTLLSDDPLPGWHGKGGYTAQGKLFLANNGGGRDAVEKWQVDTTGMLGPEKFGVLAAYDGEQYTVIERKQFTDITTKHGINAVPNDNSPLWTMGWDKRSVRLKVLDQGEWHTFLLPKATYNNDPGHGWFTEWPRIREIHDGRFMMDMHGMFYDFPPDFNAKNTGGVRPIGSHLRYIPDFLYWNGKIVLATDEVSIQGNPLAGQPQSNLWMGDFSALSEWGPASAYGAIWIEDDVTPNQPSLPFLFAGFDQRVLHLTNHSDLPISITIETDQKGNGEWVKQSHIQLPAGGYQFEIFATGLQAEWIRLSADQPAKLTANFHYTQKSKAQPKEHRNLFSALAGNTDLNSASFTKLYPNHDNFNLTVFSGNIEGDKFESVTAMELDKFSLEFIPGLRDSSALRALADTLTWNKHILPQQVFGEDETSVFLETKNGRLRLPKGQTDYPSPALRQVRELQSERVLANFHGTFYELPLEIVGEEPIYAKMRPVSTHNRMISDFATWNGLLLLGGIKSDAVTSPNLLKDPVSGAAVWIGGIDDLWKFGKPTGEGGVWKNTPVKAGVRSDLFLMTGYDQKTVSISTDRDATVTLYIHTCHYSDEIVPYQSFEVKAGETLEHQFPLGFSAHWVAAEIDKDCTATVWFTYE